MSKTIGEHTSGGRKEVKLARFDLIPPHAMERVAEVYGKGAEKYELRNWERGYAWGWTIAALERHLSAFKRRESLDPETGCHHLACVVFHALALMTFERFKLGVDDRTGLTDAPLAPPLSSSFPNSDGQIGDNVRSSVPVRGESGANGGSCGGGSGDILGARTPDRKSPSDAAVQGQGPSIADAGKQLPERWIPAYCQDTTKER